MKKGKPFCYNLRNSRCKNGHNNQIQVDELAKLLETMLPPLDPEKIEQKHNTRALRFGKEHVWRKHVPLNHDSWKTENYGFI